MCRHITKIHMSHIKFRNNPCQVSLRFACFMSILILRKVHVAVSNLRNDCVALSILGVHTHTTSDFGGVGGRHGDERDMAAFIRGFTVIWKYKNNKVILKQTNLI